MCLDYSKIIHKVDEIRKLWIQGNYEEAVNKIEEYRTGEFSLEFTFEEIDMLVMRGEFKKAEILLNNLRTSSELSTLISRYKSREFVVDYISGLSNPTDPCFAPELNVIAFPQHGTNQVLFIDLD